MNAIAAEGVTKISPKKPSPIGQELSRYGGFPVIRREYGELYPDSPFHIHAIAVGDRELSLGWELHIRISPNWGKHTLPDRWMWLGRVCYMMNEDAFFIRAEHNTTSEVVAGFVDGNEVTILSTWSDGKNSRAGWIKAWPSWYTTAGPASSLPGSTDTIGPNGNQDYKKEY